MPAKWAEEGYILQEGWIQVQIQEFAPKLSKEKTSSTYMFSGTVIDAEDEDFNDTTFYSDWLQWMYSGTKDGDKYYKLTVLKNIQSLLEELGLEYTKVGDLSKMKRNEAQSALLSMLVTKESQIISDTVGKTIWLYCEISERKGHTRLCGTIFQRL